MTVGGPIGLLRDGDSRYGGKGVRKAVDNGELEWVDRAGGTDDCARLETHHRLVHHS